MVSLLKVVGLMSSGLLCLALAYTAIAQADNSPSALDNLKSDQSDRKQDGQEVGEKQIHGREGGQSIGGKTIKGEVVRVEGSDWFIKGEDGTEVRLHIDQAALQAINSIAPGEHIEAMVNDQNQVLLFLSNPTGTNHRTDKE